MNKYFNQGYNAFESGKTLEEAIAASDSEVDSPNFYAMKQGYEGAEASRLIEAEIAAGTRPATVPYYA